MSETAAANELGERLRSMILIEEIIEFIIIIVIVITVSTIVYFILNSFLKGITFKNKNKPFYIKKWFLIIVSFLISILIFISLIVLIIIFASRLSN